MGPYADDAGKPTDAADVPMAAGNRPPPSDGSVVEAPVVTEAVPEGTGENGPVPRPPSGPSQQ
jgi:hypothetical protein